MIIDNLGISSSGRGSRTPQSHYSYKVESNLPAEPMTVDRMLEVMDQAREPGEPTTEERFAEMVHPEYDKEHDWWEGLTEAQKEWFIEKHPGVKLVTKAWEAHKEMSFADKVIFQTLGSTD